MKLKEQLPPFCEESLKDDNIVLCHTGLPNFKVLKAIFDHVLQTLPNKGINKLTPFQEFMCAMLKLRLNTPLQGLAYQFGICKATVSRIILKWLTQIDIRLQDLIIWPDRESLRKTMPMCFQESFGKKVAVIIDCFEIFLNRPSNLQARAYTWSNYKHKNTCKVLIGIVPQGTVALFRKHGEAVPVINTLQNIVEFLKNCYQGMLSLLIVDLTLLNRWEQCRQGYTYLPLQKARASFLL